MSGIATRPDIGRERYERATAHLDPPFAVVDLTAFDSNAADLVRRAGGLPIRVASKSLRCRYLIDRVLARHGYRGVMCYSLPEALWLHASGTSDDLLVAYPTADRAALRALAADAAARRNVTLTVDSTAHLDYIDATLGDRHPDIRVCLELDVSWRPLARGPLAPPGGWHRHLVRRRLRGVGHRHPGPAALAVPARRPATDRRGGCR
jgi:D-serine deaminase-like pyridoxal phosphate-dependent protein